MIQYFGTNTFDAGHYFWEINGEKMTFKGLQYRRFPFDPEAMPFSKSRDSQPKGYSEFYQIGDYSIIAILGSCKDTRPGSKSVFFKKEIISPEQLRNEIMEAEAAKQIVEQMPFVVVWPTEITTAP